MPNITPLQPDFSVGEIAPDLQMRSTLDARNRGVKTLTNFVTDARGPVIKRKGFRFLGKVGEAGCDLVPCSPAIYPVESTDPVGTIADISGGNNFATVQPTNVPYKGDGVPDEVWKYTSTDVHPDNSGVSWDMGYVLGGSGEGHFGIVDNRLLGQWTLKKGFIQFYMKRRNFQYTDAFVEDELIHMWATATTRYGIRIYLDPAGSVAGPAEMVVIIGMVGAGAQIRFRTAAIFSNEVWYKVLVKWDPSVLSETTWEQALSIELDDVPLVTTNDNRQITLWEPSDIANYDNPGDPNGDLARLFIGARSSFDTGETGFNGKLDEIYISNCDYEECLP